MSSADWDEVKRLAADFQKAQLSYSLQKLSERNCVEIITKLTELKLIDVIFTNDGKEYITPQYLAKEVKDELYVHGGRISLVDLATILNVDFNHVVKAAEDIERHDKTIRLILGQLIDKTYTTKIAEEINDKLLLNGHINVSDLTLHYDLPAEFLQSVIEKSLGKSIFGKQDTQDPRVFYTEGYVARNKAIIRGALTAITKPTPISAVLGICSVPEKIFFSVVETLQAQKQLPGIVTGKQVTNSIYVPTIYSKYQNEWVDNFYKQNGYLEYDALSRLGISDPKNFIKRHFPNEKLTLLDSVAVGSMIIDQVDANIEEVISTGSYADLYPVLPSVFSPKDIEILLKEATKRIKMTFHIFTETVVISENYFQTQYKLLEPLAEKLAKDAIDSGKYLQSVAENKLKGKSETETKFDKKAERRKKAAGGKAGGGTQGRETKTKSTKNKYLSSRNDFEPDVDEVTKSFGKLELELVSVQFLEEQLKKDENLTEIDGLINEIATYLQPTLNKHAISVAEQLSQKNNTMNLNEIEDRLNVLASNVRLFDKGIKILDKSSQPPLFKYLIKSLATDFVNDIFKVAAQQNNAQCPNALTTESRPKLLTELPNDVKEALNALHKSLTATTLDDFNAACEPAMTACCLVMKKFDKKKERPMILAHRESLLQQLNATFDPALALHIAVDVLFTVSTQNALHMSGRHVSTILSFIQPYLEKEACDKLASYHDLVLQFLSSPDDEIKSKAKDALDQDLTEIKKIANEYKKYLKSDKIREQ